MRAAPARLGSSTPAPVAWQAGVVRCHSHEEQARSCLHNVSLDYIPDLSAYHSAPSPSSPACERPRHNVGAAHHAAPCPTSHRAQQRSSISGAIQCMALCRTCELRSRTCGAHLTTLGRLPVRSRGLRGVFLGAWTHEALLALEA